MDVLIILFLTRLGAYFFMSVHIYRSLQCRFSEKTSSNDLMLIADLSIPCVSHKERAQLFQVQRRLLTISLCYCLPSAAPLLKYFPIPLEKSGLKDILDRTKGWPAVGF